MVENMDTMHFDLNMVLQHFLKIGYSISSQFLPHSIIMQVESSYSDSLAMVCKHLTVYGTCACIFQVLNAFCKGLDGVKDISEDTENLECSANLLDHLNRMSIYC